MSKTKAALDYMKRTGKSAYAAAQKFDLTPATLYNAMRKERCPHCGNYLKDAPPAEKTKKVDPLLEV